MSPSECVVVEDAAAGVEAAKAGGFRCVGLGPHERVFGADVIYPSLANVHLSDLISNLEFNTDDVNFNFGKNSFTQ